MVMMKKASCPACVLCVCLWWIRQRPLQGQAWGHVGRRVVVLDIVVYEDTGHKSRQQRPRRLVTYNHHDGEPGQQAC